MAENEGSQEPRPSLADIADAAARELAVPAAPARRPAEPKRPRRSTRRSARSLAMASGVLCLSSAIVFILIQALSSGGGATAEALLERARREASLGQLDRALSTLQSAQALEPGGATQRALADMTASVTASLVRQADRVTLDNASSALRTLLDFERIYLPADSAPTRPAARELVRSVDRWLAAYRETCERHEDHRGDAAAVLAMRERYAAAAVLGEPDDADDVLFRANHLVRLRRRRYRAAVETLGAFASGSPSDPRVAEVQALQERLRQQGMAWVQSRLRRVDHMLERSMFEDAQRELEFLTEHGLPEWEPLLAVARSRLADRE